MRLNINFATIFDLCLVTHRCVCVSSVDGSWSEWGEWSACTPECERQRGRECTAPEPKHGGRLCDGVALATDNCTGGLCTQSGYQSFTETAPRRVFTHRACTLQQRELDQEQRRHGAH